MPAHLPEDRVLVARAAAHAKWAQTKDRTAATAPARKGLLAKFERQVDPGQVLTAAERTRRAQSAMKSHMTVLALRSAQKRRAS